MPLTIRRLTPNDATAYRAIRLEALQTDPDAFGARHEHEAAQPHSVFVARLATSTIVAAEAVGTLVGMAALKRHEATGETHKAFVWGVFVSPAWRRHGLSRSLMTALLDEASPPIEHLTLTVAAGNVPAQSLYESLGFRTYGIEPRAYKTAHGYRDAILMAHFPSP